MLPLSVAECSVSSISTAKSTDLEGVEGVEGVKDEKFDFPASLEPKASSPVQTRVPKQNLSKLWWQDWIHLDSFKLCCFYTVLIVFTLSVFCGLTGLTVPSYLLAPRHRSRRSGYCKSCALPRWHAGRWPHVTTRWPLAGQKNPTDAEMPKPFQCELCKSSHFWARSCCIQSIPVSSQCQATISSKLGWILTVRSLEVRVWCAWFSARPSSHPSESSFYILHLQFCCLRLATHHRETQTFQQVETGIVVLLSTYERACALAALRIIAAFICIVQIVQIVINIQACANHVHIVFYVVNCSQMMSDVYNSLEDFA